MKTMGDEFVECLLGWSQFVERPPQQAQEQVLEVCALHLAHQTARAALVASRRQLAALARDQTVTTE